VLEQALRRQWQQGRPAVMGILNVTPDSFSDGGRFLEPAAAIDHGARLIAEGADLLDVGGESTRPGAAAVPAEVERERVGGVIRELARRFPEVPISVDTSKPEVADAALQAGARMINDVSAAADGTMLQLAAARRCAIVLMHRRGEPPNMQADTHYDDVVAEVHAFLAGRAAAALAAGIARGDVLLDPGIGFGKDVDGNLRLLAAVADLAALGHPVMIGASRKSFIGTLSGAGVESRLPGSLAAIVATAGLARAIVRVHDVAATVGFLKVLAALTAAA
jgi:dihydropteroate synthase